MTTSHPALPPQVSRPWIASAVLVWVCAALITHFDTIEPLEPGPIEGDAVIGSDVTEGRYGSWALAEAEVGTLLLDFDETRSTLSQGDIVHFRGKARGEPGIRLGRRYRAMVAITSVEILTEADTVHLRLGSAVRDRVMDRLRPFDDGRALLAGFLIGDTTELGRADVEAMRRSGLAHFVAVSGSNVALFLGLLAFAAGPLALGPKRRALVGLLGLPIYAAATRFEPSVMRASLMAGLALGGRLLGIVFEAWQLLSLAVIVLLALDPALTTSAGFQLSLVATAGVLVGARWPTKGGWVTRALAVTLGAQVAVAPLILAHFGSIPLMSPLVNVLAAPLVSAATLVAAVGVTGPGFLIGVAAWCADLILMLARGASTWPQLSPTGFSALGGAGLCALRWPRLRPMLAMTGSLVLVSMVLGTSAAPPDVGVVVLDVGQGDSILLHGGEGRFALVDGGPDELLLADRLRRYGVEALDLVVLTHVHADHATGLTGIVGRVPIGQVWARTEPHDSGAATQLLEALVDHGVPVVEPQVGETQQLGDLTLKVEGPLRRYASPNDQSIVIEVQGHGRTMLLAGDIETVAQGELDHLRSDVLKVPHQGAATSDPEWLRSVGADFAVVSVGPNQFGHPADWVIEVLEESGATVVRTDESGDIVVELG